MNFQRLWESMELAKEKKQPIEDKAVSVIRTGTGIDEKFWDNFLLLLNNAEGLGALLDVDPDTIGTWAAKINDARKKMSDSDSQEDLQKNRKLVKTGISSGEVQ